jgi:hypothetical protein
MNYLKDSNAKVDDLLNWVNESLATANEAIKDPKTPTAMIPCFQSVIKLHTHFKERLDEIKETAEREALDRIAWE